MAVIPLSDTDGTFTIMSPQGLFFGLFFGLGGGILLLIILSAIIYCRYAHSGRIRLGAGGPGELDDEQRLLEEETAAMQQLDVSQQESYYRAKGNATCIKHELIGIRISRTVSTRECFNGYFVIAISFDSGERCLGMGVYSCGFRTIIKRICTVENGNFFL